VFIRNQPEHSSGFGPLNDKRVFHSETNRGTVCYWSRVTGGTALCHRADRHGYVAGPLPPPGPGSKREEQEQGRFPTEPTLTKCVRCTKS
jgi:hypothetical protein